MSLIQNTVFSQLIQELSFKDFQKNVHALGGDKGTSKISCFSLLKSMIYSQFTRKESLRELEDDYTINTKFFEKDDIVSLKKSTVSEALINRPSLVFENTYKELVQSLQEKNKISKIRKRLKLLDSTTISLNKNLHNWADFRDTMSGIKMHILFDDKSLIPFKTLITNAKVHDSSITDQINIEKGDTFVFDRGYNDYAFWNKINKADAFFVTRIKSGTVYSITSSCKTNNNYGVLKDSEIRLTGSKGKVYPEKLRLIEYYDKETKKKLYFITNNFKLIGQTIADYYKRRWQIELFFKFIKQHLKIKKFFSQSKNGVEIQLYSALITFLLLIKIKVKLTVSIPVFKILRLIRNALYRKICLYKLLSLGKVVIRKIKQKEALLF